MECIIIIIIIEENEEKHYNFLYYKNTILLIGVTFLILCQLKWKIELDVMWKKRVII